MRTVPLGLLLVSCSSPGPSRTATPLVAVVARPEAPGVVTKPHHCLASIYPYSNGYVEPEDEPLPPPEPQATEGEGSDDAGETSVDEESPIGSEGGRSLEDKASVFATRLDEGVCDVRKRDTLEASILSTPAPPPATTAPRAWNRTTPLANRALVRGALALTTGEEAQLARDGFVVPERLAYADYTRAYYDIHRGQLPVFVSVDSIMHAVYASHDQLLAQLEREQLVIRLDAMLGALHCGLVAAAGDYPKDVASDVDVYLTVARSLLANDAVPGELGPTTDAIAQPIVAAIVEAGPPRTIELFGRTRTLDVSAYTPRGHYAGDENLERYFRSAMWLSRLEFNLVSRDTRSSHPGYVPDPSETPREAVVALALADLAERSHALPEIAALDQAWAAFAGRREDITFAELLKLRAKAGITKLTDPDAAERLRDAIGSAYQRTVNVHPNPSVPHLPAIATLLGARITPDTSVLGHLLDGRGPQHQGAEVGFMLGHDRARKYVSTDPKVVARMQQVRSEFANVPLGNDLYSAWLSAIRALAVRPAGALPAFMDGAAFEDLRLDTALAAYGQLRHNHVLIEAQMYDQGGCEIPDGYVEPAPATYRALAQYAARGRTVFAALDASNKTGGAAYFTRLERLLTVLVALSNEELANHPLSAEATTFLSMIVEMREATAHTYFSSFPLAIYDGWYIDLFPRIDDSFNEAAFVADYATFDRDAVTGVHYLGAKGPRLGIFAVDAGGVPRMMVGPVAHAFTHTGPLDHRLDDTQAATIAGQDPWAASYVATGAAEPSLSIEFQRTPKPGADTEPERELRGRARRPGADGDDHPKPNIVRLEAKREHGKVTIELLDHHFVKVGEITTRMGKGRTEVRAPATARPIESLRIRVGEFHSRVDLSLEGHVIRKFGTP